VLIGSSGGSNIQSGNDCTAQAGRAHDKQASAAGGARLTALAGEQEIGPEASGQGGTGENSKGQRTNEDDRYDHGGDPNLVVKICDMGLAKTGSMISTANEVGTAHWAAPEALRHEDYSNAADVWSFGVICWELVTMQLPYEKMNTIRVAHEVAYNGLKLTLPPSLAVDRPALATMIMSCWATAPADRPSFQQIVAAVGDLLAEKQ
jgi:serine/threonine protein kinase